jgi:hypothetical protein
VNLSDYLIDQDGKDWEELLSEWVMPEPFILWLVNRFGDLFMVYGDGSVNMLDVGSGKFARLAESQEHFAQLLDTGDNADVWLMLGFVDACVAAGMHLGPDQCYGYKMPPMLGGAYDVANIEPTDLSVHYSILAQLYAQTKDLPDGTRVRVVVDPSKDRGE